MKIVVAMDGDGHFMAAPFHDREKVIHIIDEIQDGDFVANMDAGDKLGYENYKYSKAEEWRDFLYGIQQRGTIEIIEL
jgi:hypothetical protein